MRPGTSDTLRAVEEEIVPVLYVQDAARAVAWYERLGFKKEWEHQFEPGFPWFIAVARERPHVYLSEHKGDARPNALIHLYVNASMQSQGSLGCPSMRTVSPVGSVTSKTLMATACAWPLLVRDARHRSPRLNQSSTVREVVGSRSWTFT